MGILGPDKSFEEHMKDLENKDKTAMDKVFKYYRDKENKLKKYESGSEYDDEEEEEEEDNSDDDHHVLRQTSFDTDRVDFRDDYI